ncbi:coiled-coil domain-containing protein 50 isoform X2 [Denticeps clupeoides]|uniref:coiled-coil domain-containing protein 50 isoform X2 n=1 Tax=Denticeps clupeoides TaxID=299321 RepID=UPI0010A2BB9D|nr:coiled-coil domain-containing protein 50-like isoform X2 [Denticeps clupeoides]
MSELEVDKSHLPRVYDVCQCFAVLEDGALAHNLQEQEIEQFYNSNVQKNQVVQNDVRIARRLQTEEEQRTTLSLDLRLQEQQDCEYAQMIQQEIQRWADEARRREEEDEKMAKQLQDEEEMEMRRKRAEAGFLNDSFLDKGLTSSHLRILQQVQRDAELARRLQQEEREEEERWQNTLSSGASKHQDSDADFQAAQVAQDEELAHYMQRHERKGHRRSHEGQGKSHAARDMDGTAGRTVETIQMPRQRLNSECLHSPGEDSPPECQLPPYGQLNSQKQPVRNIAEELDPTFQARKRESLLAANSTSGLVLASRTPHSVFYDYLPEPAFVPPTKRHGGKPGQTRNKEKRETCKQQ